MIIGDLTTDFEDAEFPELWPTFGFNPNATGPTGNTAYGLCRGPQINGTLTNMDPATDWVRSEGQFALDFDGSNDAIAIGNPPSLKLNSGLTLKCWCVRTNSSRWDTLIDKGEEFAGASDCDVNFGIRITNVIRFRVSNGSVLTGIESGVTPIGNGSLTQFVATWSGGTDTDGMKVYRNGRLIETATASFAIGSMATTKLWHISGKTGGTNQLFYKGQKSDIAIYSRAWSVDEVLLDYSLGPGGWARRKSPTWYIPSGQAFIDHTSNILRLMGGGVL